MDRKRKNNTDIVAVANAARVSISTVSRSFNHPELVKPATRKRIDRAVRKLGYIRNRAAQTIHGIRSGTIGVLVPTIDSAIFSEVIQTFSESVSEHGFTLLLASHGYDLELEYTVLRKLLEHRVDGIALIGLEHGEEAYQLIERQRVPAITIWNYDAASRLPCVGVDNFEAGRMAAAHLISLGHRDIALLFPPVVGNDRALARRSGAMQALSALASPRPPEWIAEARYSISDGKEAVMRLLGKSPRPTALLCGNDVLAQGAIHAAHGAGVAVPDDLSIMGIGDFKGSREMEPPLSTITLPAKEIGRIAGDQLARAIIDEEGGISRTNCPISLAARGTCRRLA